MQCLHCLFKDMIWKLLRHVSGALILETRRSCLRRAFYASWFWTWIYLNAALGAYAFFSSA